MIKRTDRAFVHLRYVYRCF